MKLILVRHGEAKSEAEDPERSLTEKGKLGVERMGHWMRKSEIKVHEIRHSGKRRAEQTALILGGFLEPLNGVFQVSGLDPNHDVLPIAQLLASEETPLMVVGHLPFLSRLASFLLVGNPNLFLCQFQPGAMVSLERMRGEWCLSWIIQPDLL